MRCSPASVVFQLVYELDGTLVRGYFGQVENPLFKLHAQHVERARFAVRP